MKRLFGLFLVLIASTGCAASPQGWGTELQLYPSGLIVAGHTRYSISQDESLFLRAGYNFTDRGDSGKHEDEEGSGPGLGVGYRRDLAGGGAQGWLYGARVDLFFLDIDWKDTGSQGSSDVIVLQPVVEGGYGWDLASGRIELTLSAGAEINIDTNGEDVGEGAIGLLGVTYLFGR